MGTKPGRAPRARALAGAWALALAAACATSPDAPAIDPRETFGTVRRVALVRRVEKAGAARARDPLDALGQSLSQRGVEVRAIEIGPRPRGEDAALARLHEDARRRAEAAPPRRGPPRPERVDAAGIPERLGVDAVAFTFRYGMRGLSARTPGGFGPVGGISDPREGLRPAGAIALVARDGTFLAYDWRPGADPEDPDAAETPIEAIEQALRALLGEPERG
jgi:hypothetical protein